MDADEILLLAAETGLLQDAQTALSMGADVNVVDHDGSTPLHLAALGNFPDVVRLLLSRGANADALNDDGLNPFSVALDCASPRAAMALISAEGKVDHVWNDGSTALHKIALQGYWMLVSELVAAKLDLEAKNQAGQTPVVVSALANHDACTKTLLLAGASADGLRDLNLSADITRFVAAFRAAQAVATATAS